MIVKIIAAIPVLFAGIKSPMYLGKSETAPPFHRLLNQAIRMATGIGQMDRRQETIQVQRMYIKLVLHADQNK